MGEINFRKWFISIMVTIWGILITVVVMVVYVDPFFHYHSAVDGLNYSLTISTKNDPGYLERYVNDGIAKHFQYDAFITGTSMAENFSTDELDDLFGTNSVKMTFSGASYKEINDNCRVALENNKNVKMVIRCLDYSSFFSDVNEMKHEASYYPQYLYNKNIFDDANYFLNKDVVVFSGNILYSTFMDTKEDSLNFNTYANWMEYYPNFGKEMVLKTYSRPPKSEEEVIFTKADEEIVSQLIENNVLSLVEEYPDVDFYFFFPPYSIYWWDTMNQCGYISRHLEAERVVVNMLLQHDNVHLFSYFDQTDIITNLDNYRDQIHYGEWVNSYILQTMATGEHEITKENYDEYWNYISDFYKNFDYDELYE